MMEVVYGCCCGIDVHKKMIVACLNKGGKQELRQFGTMTGNLRELCGWLAENECEMIAMESTASYWKPFYNLFELTELEAMVVNAAHMKALPGRKTDVKDAEWISDLLRLDQIIAGKTLSENEIFVLLHGSMRKKIGQIVLAVDGIATPLQRRLLAQVVDHIDDMTRRISNLDTLIWDYMKQYEQAIASIDALPGIARRSAETIISEICFALISDPYSFPFCLPSASTVVFNHPFKNEESQNTREWPNSVFCDIIKA